MPELPEVEHVRIGLNRRVLGAQVVMAALLRRDVLRSGVEGQGGAAAGRLEGDAAEPLAALTGARVIALHRRGKFLAIEFDRACLGVHLGMSGRLTLEEPGSPRRTHTHLEVLLAVAGADSSRVPDRQPERNPDRDPAQTPAQTPARTPTPTSTPSPAGSAHPIHNRDATAPDLLLRFHDPRRFGGLWLDPDFPEHRQRRWASLGPDALDLDPAVFAAGLRRTRRAVKTALLDQRLVAGIGNIYADEILHRAGVDPRTRGDRLARRSIERIAAATLEILAAAVVAGGSTIRDHVGVDGQAGSFEAAHQVYGRAGAACLGCGSTLTGIQLGGRTTVFCRRCQRRR